MKSENFKNESVVPGEKVRLRLDDDVVAFFKSQEDYEEMINKVLRDYVESEKKKK